MNKKVYKMYEAPKMEIVEVELQSHLLDTSTIPGDGGTSTDGGDYSGGNNDGSW